MQEVRGVRQVKPGRWEVTISHKLLPSRRVYRTFDDEQQAVAYKVLMLAQLAKGRVPQELLAVGRRTNPMVPLAPPKEPVMAPPVVVRASAPTTQLATVIGQYLRADNAKIANSDRPMVEYLRKTVSGSVEGISTIWVDAWIRSMKRKERLAPGTIRKRVESLARCIDWWNRETNDFGAVLHHPLRLLPRGYSTYHASDADGEAPRDVERNRRLLPGEYDEIVAVLEGKRREDRERPWAAGGDAEMLMLFRLIVATGLRLREAYTLKVENIEFALRTIHVRRSKTGAKRDVPMTRQLAGWLEAFVGAKEASRAVFQAPRVRIVVASIDQPRGRR